MNTENTAPQTLLEAVTYFADPVVAHRFVTNLRWPEGVTCPHCAGKDATFLEARRVWKCKAKACRKQFSAKVGTIFEDSPISLSKWLPAMWLIVNCKNGISSYELGRALKVTQKTAWFMLHRIRMAMESRTFRKLGGTVEVDESFFGGKAQFMHHAKRMRFEQKRGMINKSAIMGLLERGSPEKGHSTVRTMPIPDTKRSALHPVVRQNVEPGANVYTDSHRSYNTLRYHFVHEFVNHANEYVRGAVHTNGIENFWALAKRALKGTYVSVEPFHLFRYLDEQAFRFNHRKMNDAGRFLAAAANIIGRRLTYRDLTGAEVVPA